MRAERIFGPFAGKIGDPYGSTFGFGRTGADVENIDILEPLSSAAPPAHRKLRDCVGEIPLMRFAAPHPERIRLLTILP